MDICKTLCEQLLVSEHELLSYAASAPFRYKKYRIAKRNSKETRLIAQPAKPVKFIQRMAIKLLHDVIAPNQSAKAYVEGSSIKENASAHSRNKYILKMDFKNFFLSITPELLFWVFEKKQINISEIDKTLLAGLFFWKLRRNSPLRLSIGAPSSPAISNFVMILFDEEISTICKNEGVTYTRYADDITFSTNKKDVLFDFPRHVKACLKRTTKGKIIINSSKTVFSSKGHNRHVTGVTITNEGKLSVGRQKKRFISSLVHKFSLNLIDEKEREKLIGLISFVEHIEAGFISKLVAKYGRDTIDKLYESA